MSYSHHITNNKVSVFTEKKTPRIEYTFDFVFRCVLGMNITWIFNTKSFEAVNSPKINYSTREFISPNLLFLPHPLLLENEISDKHHFSLDTSEEIPFIKSEGEQTCPFATIFFFLSRYEEYLDHPTDIHGRFTKKISITEQEKCSHLPVADMWIDWLRNELNNFFSLDIPKPKTSFLSTFDIDHVRAFQWKGIPRGVGALAKNIVKRDWETLSKRIGTWIGKEKDPYDVFDYLDEIHHKWGVNLLYFWLLGTYNEFDKNPNPKNSNFRKEIRKHSGKHPIGIHPSYLSFLDDGKISKEISALSEITKKSIFRSRFHFLRYNLPHSYQQLIRLGIEEDYSMGYPDGLGFRAGTSHSFLWYDLSKEEITTLTVHPFQIMDVTLKNYMKLSPNEALGVSLGIIDQIQRYGGTLILLWHNSSFEETEWKGWKDVFEKILEKGVTLLPSPSPE